MFANTSNDLNREYIYVRRLISVLTNDDSDKLIVEKLKGKNLSSLLYNAKIIDNSKNMTANKKILACVIRAIEREKHLCRKRELEQSWGRKFLNSFNCLSPGLKENEDYSEVYSGSCLRKSSHKMKHRTLSRCTKTSSGRKTPSKKVSKNGCNSSIRCTKAANQLRNKPNYVEGFRDKTHNYVESIVLDKADDGDWQVCHQVPVSYVFMHQKVMYETIRPLMLRQKKLNCVVVHPGKSLPAVRRVERAEKRSSSTQTPDNSDPEMLEVPNRIKLQDLLEAASNLLSRRDQKEYVQAFLNNYEPPFDLSGGFPPYLKLPMNTKEDAVLKESVYGTNSELSLMSGPVEQPQRYNDVIKQKDENVRKYVRELMMNEPWQETAESVISGVISENLPLDKDYSQLGACILKRLGAFPDSNETRNKQNPYVPEMILQCMEFFESDTAEQESAKTSKELKVNEEEDVSKDGNVQESPSIEEIKLTDPKPWNGQNLQNYCFLEGNTNNQEIGLLNLSESSLVGLGIYDSKSDVGHGDKKNLHLDRKNLTLREPLMITPSGLEQGGKKKKGGVERKSENPGKSKAESKRVPMVEPNEVKKPERQRVSIFTATENDRKERRATCDQSEPLIQIEDPADDCLIETVSILKPDGGAVPQPKPESTRGEDVSARILKTTLPAEITETPTPPPEPQWELMVTETETFSGIGEGLLTELATIPEKNESSKRGRIQEKNGGKKKCKSVTSKKARSTRNELDPSRNCRVM